MGATPSLCSKKLLLAPDEAYDGNLGWGEETDRRSPGPRTPAHVEGGRLSEGIKAGKKGESNTGYEIEGEYLPLVGVTGKLEVKETE